MKARKRFMPGVESHCGSVTSIWYWAVRMPLVLSSPAGFSTAPTEAETLVMMWIGCQPSSATFLIACAANFGVAMLMKMSGLALLIATTWESTVGMAIS